uniref:Expansin-like EG45 domain-containing protein n=1 Tax=Globisporangium ultimum (strain ATCC 200006 / CBS 805.95 / DAOM BR144) TaxID=431595 RepID=K3W680_GLOUD
MIRSAAVLAILASVALGKSTSAQQTFSGDGTRYGGNALGGTCGFSTAWKSWTPGSMELTAALNLPQWNASLNCGRCVSAQHGSNAPVVVQIVDQCPECKHGDLDFAPEAYTAVTQKSPGREPISWSFVDCPSIFVSGNLEFVMKKGSNNFWAAFQPQNFKRGIGQVEINVPSTGKGWQALVRQESTLVGFYFLFDGGIDGSFQLRATATDGSEMIESPTIQSIDTSMSCDKQFMSSDTADNDASQPAPQYAFEDISNAGSDEASNAAIPTQITSAPAVATDAPTSPAPASVEPTLPVPQNTTPSTQVADNDTPSSNWSNAHDTAMALLEGTASPVPSSTTAAEVDSPGSTYSLQLTSAVSQSSGDGDDTTDDDADADAKTDEEFIETATLVDDESDQELTDTATPVPVPTSRRKICKS